MSLQSWLENGWLRQHRTSKKEIADLFRIIERDLQDAEGGISDDWRFGIAYNAALKLCTILLYAEGFRPERTLQHYRTIRALPIILGENRKADADYLDSCPEQIQAIFDAIRQLMAPKEASNKRIGFQLREKRAAYGKE
jgi:hypothetical protein